MTNLGVDLKNILTQVWQNASRVCLYVSAKVYRVHSVTMDITAC